MESLVAALVGAIIGAASVHWFQDREFKKLGKGAARAVYMEMASNQTSARIGGHYMGGTLIGSVHAEVWIAEAARLGAYLEPRELMAVTWAYTLIPDAAIALETLRAGGGYKADDPERALLLEVVETIEPATRLLNAKVWTEAERADLDKGVPGWRGT